MDENGPEIIGTGREVGPTIQAELMERKTAAERERAEILEQLFATKTVHQLLESGSRDGLVRLRSGRVPAAIVFIDTDQITELSTYSLDSASRAEIVAEYLPLDLPKPLTKKEMDEIRRNPARHAKYEDRVSIIVYDPQQEERTILRVSALFGIPQFLRVIGPHQIAPDEEHFDRIQARSSYMGDELGFQMRGSDAGAIEDYQADTRRVASIVEKLRASAPAYELMDEFSRNKRERYGVQEDPHDVAGDDNDDDPYY